VGLGGLDWCGFCERQVIIGEKSDSLCALLDSEVEVASERINLCGGGMGGRGDGMEDFVADVGDV